MTLQKEEKIQRMKMRSVTIFLTWRAAALPEGTSGNCCSCWSLCCPAVLSYQTSARRGGSSHSTQDITLAVTGGSDCSQGQSKLEAGCRQEIKSKCLPLIDSDTNNSTACRRDRGTHGERKRRDKDWLEEEEKQSRGGRRDRTGTLDDKTPGGQTQDGGQLEERMREKKTQQREGNKVTRRQLTCIPMTAYMKNSITISRAT